MTRQALTFDPAKDSAEAKFCQIARGVARRLEEREVYDEAALLRLAIQNFEEFRRA